MSKKGWLTLLLGACCFLAATLHVEIDPKPTPVLNSPSQLDSLIAQTTYDFRISSDQIRTQTVAHDSLFQRKVYTLFVAPGFSKTTFHHHLNTRLEPLNVSIYGSVTFPEKDLELNLLYNDTVHRTLHIRAESDLSIQRTSIPRLPD